jgi:hypothetical protein
MRRVVSTMVPTKREKAFCVLEFAKSGSVITVQRRFRTRYGEDPPGPELYQTATLKQTFRDSSCERTSCIFLCYTMAKQYMFDFSHFFCNHSV